MLSLNSAGMCDLFKGLAMPDYVYQSIVFVFLCMYVLNSKVLASCVVTVEISMI